MRFILVVSTDQEALKTIHSCYRSAFRVTQVPGKTEALEALRHRRYDFVFIDIALLREGISRNDYRSALQDFWQIFATLEIVVMTPPARIREALGNK